MIMKSAGWAGSLETQGRASVVVQVQRLSADRIQTQSYFHHYAMPLLR